MTKTVGIYGIGNFGYALLRHFDMKSEPILKVRAYDRNPEVARSLSRTGRHPFLHGSTTLSRLPALAGTPHDLADGLDVLIMAVSSDATRDMLSHIAGALPAHTVLLNTAKALDRETGKRLSCVVGEAVAPQSHRYALMAGGTIASDLFRHEPLGIDIACDDLEVARELKDLLESENLSAYVTADLVGVEYASAFKNVIAVMAGIVHGLGFSYGAETHVISRMAAAMGDVAVSHLGAHAETFSIGSQCWGNDMWMSCTGPSRNRHFGVLLGQGLSVAAAEEQMTRAHKTIEALNTLRVVPSVPGLMSIQLVRLLHAVVVTGQSTPASIRELLLGRLLDAP